MATLDSQFYWGFGEESPDTCPAMAG